MSFGCMRMRNQQTVLHRTPQLNHQRILSLKLGKAHLFIARQNLYQKLHPEARGIVYVEFFFYDFVISVKDLFPKGLMNLFTNYLVIGFFCGTIIFSPTLIFVGMPIRLASRIHFTFDPYFLAMLFIVSPLFTM